MKKLFRVLCALSFLLLIASCSISNTSSDFLCKFTDSEGEKTVKYNPTNVALLYPSFGDIWISTGGVISIGVEDCITRGYAKEDITIVGSGTGKDIDLESLVKAQPDFTILSSDFPNHTKIASALASYGMAYGIFEFSSFEDYINILEIFSNINKNDNAYKKYGVELSTKINEIIEASKTNKPRKVLLLRATSSSLKALDKSNFVGDMLVKLGCINIADTNKSLTSALSMESIITSAPDVILVVPMGTEDVVFSYAKKELETEVWKNIPSVKNNLVYYMEKDLFHYKPNVRWSEAYEILSERVYK